MLLCVSASVVTLGAVGGGAETGEYAAVDAADRIATETATVTYEVDGEDHGSRTVHATLAELLAMSARGAPGADGDGGDRFRSRALERVADTLGGRIRVDVRYEATAPSSGTPTRDDGVPTRPDGEVDAWTVGIGSEPPAGADVSATVLTHPGSRRHEGARAGRFRIVVRAW
jgi:hypothetical protein